LNKYGVDWEKQPIFFNVATGASITGYARAALLRAIHTVGPENVVYCDTDSLAVLGDNWKKLHLGKELGQWDIEGEAEIGHFAGKKLYGMRLKKDNPKAKTEYKIACKGSKLLFDDLRKIVGGEEVTWKNEAPTFSYSKGIIPGSNIDQNDFFMQRKISATSPQLKPRKDNPNDNESNRRFKFEQIE